jgi:plasmid maintenance system antidote protein VapI
MKENLPAFHVGEYLADELEARGWTSRDLAERMGGEVDINHLTIDLTIAASLAPAGHCAREATLDRETAEAWAKVFGTNAETWLNLDREFQRREFGDE